MSDKIRCEDARLLASRELDDELGGVELARLEAHLEGCAPCRADSAALGRVDSLVTEALADHPFDASLVRDILRQTTARAAEARAPRVAASSRAAEPRGILLTFRAAGLVAAAAAAVVVVGLALQGGPGTPTDPTREQARPVVARAYGAGIRITHGQGEQGHAAGTAPGHYQEVRSGELVLNGGGRLAALVLEDGTRVDLRPDTAVTLHRERDGGTTVALAPSGGEVYCEVAKQVRPFRVTSGSLTATVLGTRFLVRSSGREVNVGVVEGRVQVASAREQVVLSAHQEAVLGSTAERPTALVARPLADEREQLAWNPRVLATLAPAPVSPTAGAPTIPQLAPVVSPSVGSSPDAGLDDPVAPPKKK